MKRLACLPVERSDNRVEKRNSEPSTFDFIDALHQDLSLLKLMRFHLLQACYFVVASPALCRSNLRRI